MGAGFCAISGVLHTEAFTYNMQGMLTGINAPYVTQASNTGKEYFGELLSYTSGFTTNQYNGGIAGVQWKNAGDSTARAYGYTYDNVGRLTRADFTQQNSGATAWTNDKVNYTVSNLTYDAGGNILTMSQRGLLGVGGNALIDSLAYTYLANTNRLQKVADRSTAGGMLGDFKDTTSTADDYAYDANGNIVKDNNRRLHNTNGTQGTVFNLLDKPDSMAVAGKSCTYYTYDAAGSTLSKKVKDYRTNTTKIYTYVGGFVYLSSSPLTATVPLPDTLQYAMFEEGRIRWKTSTEAFALPTVVFDYMLKDHAGNVRTVITDELRTDDYPAATMDTTTAIKNKENEIYAGLNLTRVAKPAGYPAADNFPIPNANNYVAKVQGNAGSQKIGPSITLKVMKGDKFDFYVSSYYQAATTSAPLTSPLLDIVNGLSSGVSGSSVLNTHGVTSTQLQTAFTPNVTSFLNTQPPYTTGSTVPLAYVNWVLFDEQFNLVRSTSSFERVSAAGVIETHVRTGMPITQSGYLYIYVSNTTPNIPVYFDNLKVKHIRGALLETNEFYPYGLKMANISYKSASTITNRYGWNGGNEYEDEGELNYSNTFYRKYDAQIGRFTGVDMLAEKFVDLNPYQFGANNPVMFNDPMGDKFGGANGERLSQMNAHPLGREYGWSYNIEDLFSYGGGGGGNGGGGVGNGPYANFWNALFGAIDNGYTPKKDKNGNWGYWSWSSFDPGINGGRDGYKDDLMMTNNGGVGLMQTWNSLSGFGGGIDENKLKDFIKSSDYVNAYRYIFNGYPEINKGLVEGRDYQLHKVVATKGGFATLAWIPGQDITKRNPMTTVIGKGKFDAYLNGGWYKFGDLVRDVYHESVHINLYFGKLERFGAFSLMGDNNYAHEVIASYYELTNKTLPPMSVSGMLGIANYGKSEFGLITTPSLITSLGYMNNFFKTIKK
jgi:RHS repeat-associated protein